MRIIDKTGPLTNPADRDHCLQYMTAVALIRGTLSADDYRDEAARDPRIDRLRACTQVAEEPRYSRDYLDPSKRSIANAVQVFFADGTRTPRVEVEYPLGHGRRRAEGLPLLREKFARAIAGRLGGRRCRAIQSLFDDADRLDATPVPIFIDLFASDAPLP